MKKITRTRITLFPGKSVDYQVWRWGWSESEGERTSNYPRPVISPPSATPSSAPISALQPQTNNSVNNETLERDDEDENGCYYRRGLPPCDREQRWAQVGNDRGMHRRRRPRCYCSRLHGLRWSPKPMISPASSFTNTMERWGLELRCDKFLVFTRVYICKRVDNKVQVAWFCLSILCVSCFIQPSWSQKKERSKAS